jgi:hypothetical protein
MKVYTVTKVSSGEVRLEVDAVEVCATKAEAKKVLKRFYKDVLEDVDGYDIIDKEFGNDTFTVEIDDDYSSQYYGEINVSEIQ